MNYPTMEEVEVADREQLGVWWRYLPSPASHKINCEDPREFQEVLDKEAAIMDRIAERFKAMGMFDSELSKKIGFGERPYQYPTDL